MEHSEITLPNEVAQELPDALAPLEMNEFDQYASEWMPEAIRVSEGQTNEFGWHTPGQVQEIDPEAVEFDPELQELNRELDSWIQQGERMSCAVACQTMVVNQLTGERHTEQELIDIGETKGWYKNGTSESDVGKIAEHMGLEVEQRKHVEASELMLANDPEIKVLANVDTLLLHYPECERMCTPNHVVQVLRVENTAQGERIILNDPGHEEGRGAVYSMEAFQKAYQGDITLIRKAAKA